MSETERVLRQAGFTDSADEVLRLESEIAALKARLDVTNKALESVLCVPEGKVCLLCSDADIKIIQDALASLAK